MSFTLKLIGSATVLWFAAAPMLPAQGRRGGPRYDPSTETTISGTVQEVQEQQRGPMTGIHLMVHTGASVTEVHLGPASFVAQKGFTFAKGDSVQVTGSKVTLAGTEVVIAREVVKDGKTLTLRDKDGIPLWSRGDMRTQAGCCRSGMAGQ